MISHLELSVRSTLIHRLLLLILPSLAFLNGSTLTAFRVASSLLSIIVVMFCCHNNVWSNLFFSQSLNDNQCMSSLWMSFACHNFLHNLTCWTKKSFLWMAFGKMQWWFVRRVWKFFWAKAIWRGNFSTGEFITRPQSFLLWEITFASQGSLSHKNWIFQIR